MVSRSLVLVVVRVVLFSVQISRLRGKALKGSLPVRARLAGFHISLVDRTRSAHSTPYLP